MCYGQIPAIGIFTRKVSGKVLSSFEIESIESILHTEYGAAYENNITFTEMSRVSHILFTEVRKRADCMFLK